MPWKKYCGGPNLAGDDAEGLEEVCHETSRGEKISWPAWLESCNILCALLDEVYLVEEEQQVSRSDIPRQPLHPLFGLPVPFCGRFIIIDDDTNYCSIISKLDDALASEFSHTVMGEEEVQPWAQVAALGSPHVEN